MASHTHTVPTVPWPHTHTHTHTQSLQYHGHTHTHTHIVPTVPWPHTHTHTVPTVPETVVFSVVIHRNQQSLGITLTGNRDTPGHPVVISKIKADGVAYK